VRTALLHPLTLQTVLPTFFLIGILFAPIGGLLLWGSSRVSEFTLDYSQCQNQAGANLANMPSDQYSYSMASGGSGPSAGPQWSFTNSSDGTAICTLQFQGTLAHRLASLTSLSAIDDRPSRLHVLQADKRALLHALSLTLQYYQNRALVARRSADPQIVDTSGRTTRISSRDPPSPTARSRAVNVSRSTSSGRRLSTRAA